MKKICLVFVWIVFGAWSALAQNNNGAIKVVLQDSATKEAIPFANVVVYKDGVQVGVATTDIDGVVVIKPLAPDTYTVQGVYVGYKVNEIKDVLVEKNKTTYITIPLLSAPKSYIEWRAREEQRYIRRDIEIDTTEQK